MKIHPDITQDMIITAAEDGEFVGFCIRCGKEAQDVEPDAEEYECDVCGELGVYGAEQLLILTM